MEVMIRLADKEDAALVHAIMLEAFEEYRNLEVPSSAIHETVSSIQHSLQNGHEQALLCFVNGLPSGSARFKMNQTSLHFSRLSISPTARGKGIAKKMLRWLEDYAKEHDKSKMICRVRTALSKNIRLYETLSYNIVKEETVTNLNGFSVKTVVMEKAL
ncbi:N-acetyltransferase family protein [Bacillus sp. S14(2024)]|uniref:GNAT family N-acetyltransferase n=1 Tax=Bacillus sp. S14(2024) TaxID=3162884 RepID=UPI003D1D1CCD